MPDTILLPVSHDCTGTQNTVPADGNNAVRHGVPPVHLLGHSGTFEPAYYLQNHPDLMHLGTGILEHYHQHGWKEGRKPNPFFDPHWYLEHNREVVGDPLLHYVLHGESEGRRPIAWFDPIWYRKSYPVPDGMLALTHFLRNRHSTAFQPIPEFDPAFYLNAYPDVAASGLDPLEHYMIQGFREIRKPFEGFDPVYYRKRYLRHSHDANPLLHYLENKHRAGIHPAQPANELSPFREAQRRTAPNPLFEEQRAIPPNALLRARIWAYYLPQFHATEENNAWWGTGFTEWTNISRGMPRFADHYQPRIPRDLGHYTLDNPDILKRQAKMAKKAGIEGFIFYFYWFNGRRLLDGPLKLLLAHPEIELPFCLMWANENWSRRWDGSDEDVLITQDYHEDDDISLIDCFVQYLQDPRYIHIAGRPVLMVYRPGSIPNSQAAFLRWREIFKERHNLNPIFVMGQAFGDEDPTQFGLDGAIEFPPHKVVSGCRLLNQDMHIFDHDFEAHIYDYSEVVNKSLSYPKTSYPLIRTAAPSWDNDARRQGKGLVLHGSTPTLYERWLHGLIDQASENPFFGETIVCVNAWNEWAEGAYLEPDVHFGSAYLNATARANMKFEGARQKTRLLLIGHDAFPAGAQKLLLELGRSIQRNHDAEIRFILLDGGELFSQYQEVAPSEILTANSPEAEERLQALKKEGFFSALVNSAAASPITTQLYELNIQYFISIHELEGIIKDRNLFTSLKEACENARKIIVPHNEISKRLKIKQKEKIIVCPQGLYNPKILDIKLRNRVRRNLSINNDEILIVSAGYGDKRKGFDIFLECWEHLNEQNVHMVWVGKIDSQLKYSLNQKINKALDSGKFHLVGQVENIYPFLCAGDVFLLTSREDPYPSVILEALASGLTCCVFENTGGIPHLLKTMNAHKKHNHKIIEFGKSTDIIKSAIKCGKESINYKFSKRQLNSVYFSFDSYVNTIFKISKELIPKISVAVISYNYSDYIRERLMSIFSQTFPISEIIFVDDSSSDNSVEIAINIARLWNKKIKIFRNKKNSGSVFHQWEIAVNSAQGDLIWLAEADDLADSNFLEKMANKMLRNNNIVMSFSDSKTIDHNGNTIEKSYRPYYKTASNNSLEIDNYFDGLYFIKEFLSENNLILNVSSALFLRNNLSNAIEKSKSDLKFLQLAGDWRIYLEILRQKNAKIYYDSSNLNSHRRHAKSVTHSIEKNIHIREIQILKDIAKSINIY